ncbi:MAG: hydantoinase/oxoprolinase N-terminal domain-containing protein, partial [Actinomycetota bacterium]
MSGVRVGIDTGGTFTDVVAIDEASGRIVSTKTPSTPADPSEGFMTGVAKILEHMGSEAVALTTVSHGTTVATNALLQEDFTGLGFITTEGFRHLLEIARQSVPEGYGNSYFWVKPERIVPLHLVREVPERLDASGDVVRAFDETAAVSVARWYEEQGINSVAVCFVNAYVNPAHEQRMRAVLRAEHPDCAVSISSDVLREYREYERSVTTLVDAFVKPKISNYITGIKTRLDEFSTRPPVLSAGAPAPARSPRSENPGPVLSAGAPAPARSPRSENPGGPLERVPGAVPFYVMKSNGGVMSADEIGGQPITTILSGPAAGVLGAAMIARQADFGSVLTLDAGGTSTDVSVVRRGEPTMTTEGSVGRWPVKVPMVDVVTVGTGGGSIAWVAPDGGLKVGP